MIHLPSLSDVIRFRRGDRIPKGYDSIQLTQFQQWSHNLLLGKTGVGKTQLLRQFRWQAKRNRWPSVTFDPERQLIQEDLGADDVVLCAEDDRVPYWAIEREFKGLGEALTLARCLLSRGNANASDKNDIWYGWGTNALAGFLEIERERKTLCMERLCEALANPVLIRKALQGTAYANMLPEKAPEQTAGVEGMLMKLAIPLSLMPSMKSKKHPSFSMREFLDDPRSRTIWITTLAQTREANKPLFTAWMSLALRGIMSREENLHMMVLCDELQLMDHIEPFMEAFTNMRKRESMMVAGTQTMAQGRLIYGDEWDVISSMPGQTWWFSTSGKGIEEAVKEMGDETFVRAEYSETDSGGLLDSPKRTVHTKLYTEPIVPASEIQGLKNLQAWFSQRGFGAEGASGHMIAIPVEVPVIRRPRIAPALVARKMPPMKIYQAEPPPAKATANGTATPEPKEKPIAEQQAALEQEKQQRQQEQNRQIMEERRRKFEEAEAKRRQGKPARKTSAQRQNEKLFGDSRTAVVVTPFSKQPHPQEEEDEGENPYQA